MASREITDKVKNKLFENWLPDKPGGLHGLIDMATEAALSVVADRVEFLEGELEACVLPPTHARMTMGVAAEKIEPGQLVAYNGEGQLVLAQGSELGDDSGDVNPLDTPGACDCAAADLAGGVHIEDCPAYQAPVDQTRYLCPQCAVTHQRDSGVGTRHAHLFYGGAATTVHLEHCPVLEDAEATCNCDAVVPGPGQRALDRRGSD
jgi:hypothetical protein